MSGYQAIPIASIDGIENGEPLNNSAHLSDGTSTSASSSAPSLPSKVVYVSLGIIVGCISSKVLSRWGGGVDSYYAQVVPSAATMLSRNSQSNFVVNGKSFFDSLPFEEVTHISWDPTHTHPQDEEGLPLMSNALTTIEDEAQLAGGVPVLGSSSNAAPAPSSASTTPHLLYHAHQSAFGLLYDSSKSSNNYLSEYSLDYFLLNSGGFDAQINQAYCAVATVAAILNSLKYAKRFREGGDLSEWSFNLPIDPHYDPYPYATQEDILMGDCVWNSVIHYRDGVNGIFTPPYGLTMEQVGKLLKCHASEEWDVSVQEVDPSKLTLSRMRYDLKAALIDPDARVMINYDRKALGQVGGGHFSPVGAYHAPTDSFLVVDVAKYKYPPVWVGADALFRSLATVDSCGTYDYPEGQDLLADNASDGTSYINPITHEDYAKALEVLNCKPKMRGYVILRKKGL